MDTLTQTAIGTTIRLNMDYESALARVTERSRLKALVC
jgi:hypothetical protein